MRDAGAIFALHWGDTPPAVHLAMQNSSFALHAVRLARQCNSMLYVHFGAPCSTLVAVVRFAGDSGPEMPRTCEVHMALESSSDGLRAMALVCFYFFPVVPGFVVLIGGNLMRFALL